MPARTLLWIGAVTLAMATAAHAAMTISNAKTRNVTCTGGVCVPTGSNANLNTAELQTMLASSDMTVKSNAAAPDIGILDPLTWATTRRLTLDAYESIHVRAPVAVEGTSGLTLTTNDGGTGGDYTFNTTISGAITFWDVASSLVINGKSFALVQDIKTLAGNIAAHPARAYALAADYDARADGTYSAAAIPTTFSGTFEGLGHSIARLKVITKTWPGGALFADLGPRSEVRDLGLTSVSVQDAPNVSASVAALAVQNEGRITYAFSTGSIKGRQMSIVGGLVATNSGKIVESSSSVHVAAVGFGSKAGGLVGITSGSIENSHATGSVKEQYGSAAGGLAGMISGGDVVASFATGDVDGGQPRHGQDVRAGGLAGINMGSIIASFAAGAVANLGSSQPGSCCLGNSYLGGLAGGNQGTILNAYATGSLSLNTTADEGYDDCGGLVGLNTGSVETVYSTGHIDAARGDWGGLLGGDFGTAKTAYWDFDTSGIADPGQGAGAPRNDPGITGLTNAQLKSGLPDGFDPNIWSQDVNINNGWPYLLANPPQ